MQVFKWYKPNSLCLILGIKFSSYLVSILTLPMIDLDENTSGGSLSFCLLINYLTLSSSDTKLKVSCLLHFVPSFIAMQIYQMSPCYAWSQMAPAKTTVNLASLPWCSIPLRQNNGLASCLLVTSHLFGHLATRHYSNIKRCFFFFLNKMSSWKNAFLQFCPLTQYFLRMDSLISKLVLNSRTHRIFLDCLLKDHAVFYSERQFCLYLITQKKRETTQG